jgi:hypothetical protein
MPAEVAEKLPQLEAELRKSKRAEQKLQAMLFRLRKDLQEAGGDMGAFDNLKDVRQLEYEVDFLANKVKVGAGGRACGGGAGRSGAGSAAAHDAAPAAGARPGPGGNRPRRAASPDGWRLSERRRPPARRPPQKYEKICHQTEAERQQLQRQCEALQAKARGSSVGVQEKENLRLPKRV